VSTYLTVEGARQLTRNERGRLIGRKAFRELVRRGVIPSWRNPLNGHLFIPETAMHDWLAGSATHEPKGTHAEWKAGGAA
jgi:hypothetical protein